MFVLPMSNSSDRCANTTAFVPRGVVAWSDPSKPSPLAECHVNEWGMFVTWTVPVLRPCLMERPSRSAH